ncbi:MAG: PT domain-containing protein [Thermomicrobiales bacterium]
MQAEEIAIERQVLVVGGDGDLAALLILTSKRLALVAGGEIVIEIPRAWLRPQPRLVANNGIRLFVTPENEQAGVEDTERLLLRARDGRGAAMQVISAITGRPYTDTRTPSTAPSLPSIPAEIPNWRTAIGAAPTVALPPLPDFAQMPAKSASRGEGRSWPPVEKNAIPAAPRRPARETPSSAGTADRAGISAVSASGESSRHVAPSPSISSWTAQHLDASKRAPVPAPVPNAVSRAARRQGTLADGVTIADDSAPAVLVAQDTGPGLAQRSLVWGLRLAIILVILGTGVYLGRDYLREQARDMNMPIPARIEQRLGITAPDDQKTAQTDTTNQIAAGAGSNDAVATLPPSNGDNIRDDRGGTTGPLPTTTVAAEPTAAPTGVPVVAESQPTEEPAIAPTEEPVVVPTDEPVFSPTEEPAIVPTDEPVVEPTAEPTQEPTAVPTQEPTLEPTAVPTQEPTLEPTAVPTQEPTSEPTAEPTSAPTEAPTAQPTQEPTIAPTNAVTPAPTSEPTVAPTATEAVNVTPTLEPQAPSVDPSVTPAQQIADASFRYSIDGASLGESVPDLPQINTVTYGEWLVLSVTGQNTSDSNQVFDMSAFRLLADGEEIQVDVGNAWVSSLLGYTPAYGNTDSILWAPGESHQFALTFLAPLDAQSLVLQVGDQSMDLSSALASGKSLAAAAGQETAAQPEFIEGKVVDVVNAETIVVEIDGVQQPVRYLGLDAPTGDECFAGDATKANAALVDGKTVRIERQATNTDAKGNWVRDVWTPAGDGRYEMVSAMLVNQGAARAGVTEPNTRFSGWLMGSEAAAKAQGLGLWKACGDSATTPAGGEQQAPVAGTESIPVARLDAAGLQDR